MASTPPPSRPATPSSPSTPVRTPPLSLSPPSPPRRSCRKRRAPTRYAPLARVDPLWPTIAEPAHDAPAWVRLGLRRGVFVGPSEIAGLRERGLFAPEVSAGALLAIVWGELAVVDVDDGTPPCGWLCGRHTMQHDDILMRPTADGMSAWAAANEPPYGSRANSVWVAWYEAADVVAGLRRAWRLGCTTLHSAQALAQGEEILVHYGAAYEPVRVRMGYVAGKPAELRRDAIVPSERPAAVFGGVLPRGSVVWRA